MVEEQSSPGSSPRRSPSEANASGAAARGAFWTVLGQVTPMGVTIFLTPYIIHGLGVTRYGLLVLVASLVSFLSILDGGTRGTATRYFGVYAGSGDRGSTTKLLLTMLVTLCVVGVVLGLSGWFVATPIVDLLRMPSEFRPQSIFLFRTLGVLITFNFLRSAFGGILQAHNRFAFLTKTSFACYALWALGLVATVHFNWGLRGVAVIFLAQQLLLVLTIVPSTFPYLDGGSMGFLKRAEVRDFLSFSARIQLGGIAFLINTEFDNIIIGGALNVRSVSLYDTGTNFAENMGSLVNAALAPAQTIIANTYGRDGEEAALARYKRLQHLWVVGLTGWFAAGGGAAYFAVAAWLGHEFRVAGVIAVVAMGTNMLFLFNSVLSGYCNTLGRPGPYSRAATISVVVNVLCTVPLLLTGPIGVAVGTLIGQLAGLCYLVRAARRHVSSHIPNIFRSIAVLPGLATVAVVVGLELLVRPLTPEGGLGLIACGIPSLVGLAVYALVLLGPRRCRALGRNLVREARSSGPVTAFGALLRESTEASPVP